MHARWATSISVAMTVALAVAAPSPSRAQATTVRTTTVQTTTVQVDVQVETEVHTVPPPATLVVVEPEASSGIAAVVGLRGQVLLTDEDAFLSLGGGAAVGVSFDRTWTASIVGAYLGDLEGHAELDLGLEVARELAPRDPLGLYLVFGIGAAIDVGEASDARRHQRDVRVMGQAGVGARTDIGNGVALTLDLRGVVRYAPPDVHDPLDDGAISGGAMLTLGLAMDL